MTLHGPPDTEQRAFLGTVDSVKKARDWLRELLEALGVPKDAIENTILVLSELASNSVQHSRSSGPHGSYVVRLRCHGDSALRLEVTDAGGETEPRTRRNGMPSPWARSGRGLALVEEFSTRWWVRGGSRGRTVGAEIALEGVDEGVGLP